MTDCPQCHNQRELADVDGVPVPCPACSRRIPLSVIAGAMDAARAAVEREAASRCHEDIVCPDCHEHTTRHEPCCPGTPQCECVDCSACGTLAPEWEPGFCKACWIRKERHEYAETVADARDWWRAKL